MLRSLMPLWEIGWSGDRYIGVIGNPLWFAPPMSIPGARNRQAGLKKSF